MLKIPKFMSVTHTSFQLFTSHPHLENQQTSQSQCVQNEFLTSITYLHLQAVPSLLMATPSFPLLRTIARESTLTLFFLYPTSNK